MLDKLLLCIPHPPPLLFCHSPGSVHLLVVAVRVNVLFLMNDCVSSFIILIPVGMEWSLKMSNRSFFPHSPSLIPRQFH